MWIKKDDFTSRIQSRNINIKASSSTPFQGAAQNVAETENTEGWGTLSVSKNLLIIFYRNAAKSLILAAICPPGNRGPHQSREKQRADGEICTVDWDATCRGLVDPLIRVTGSTSDWHYRNTWHPDLCEGQPGRALFKNKSLPRCEGFAAWIEVKTSSDDWGHLHFRLLYSVLPIDAVVQIRFPGVNMCHNKVLLPFDLRGESKLTSCPSSSIHPLISHLCWSMWYKKVGGTPMIARSCLLKANPLK